MTEHSETAPATTHGKWKEAVDSSYTGWLFTIAKVGFLGYLIVNREQTAEIVGLGSADWWRIGLFVVALHFFGSFAMSVASVICNRHTGIVYGHDRKAFALVGGFDVGWWPMLGAQTGLYAVYWWTSDQTPDPLGWARNPWLFVAISTVLGLVLTGIVAAIVFPRPGLLGRLQMPAQLIAGTRLEIKHRTMPFMLLVGAASLGFAVWLYLGDPGWKEWIGIGISTVVGLVVGLGAVSSRVVFDKGVNLFEARHRFLFGTRRHEERLSDISAIAVRRDKTGGSLLAVVCIRVGGRDLPITMFGSPFGAAVNLDGARIAHFLDLPLVVADRLVIESPEDHIESAVMGGLSKLAADEPANKKQITVDPDGGFRATCPFCGRDELIAWHRALDPSAYSVFELDLGSASEGAAVRCRNCGVPAVISPIAP